MKYFGKNNFRRIQNNVASAVDRTATVRLVRGAGLAAVLVFFALLQAPATLAQTLATIITPANAATNVDPGAAFTWSKVSDAQAYYIYVGSQKGLEDIYGSNSLSTSITSITPTGLKPNTLYYLRLWTEINGCWCSNYVDTTFTTGPGSAHLTFPANGATNVDLFAPFTWSSVSTAKSYTLNIGTSPGGSNVFSSGAVTVTSMTIPGLAINTTYYASLTTQFSSGTITNKTTFTTGTGLAHLITPANGAVNVSPSAAMTWNAVSNAQAYYLYIGTSVGSENVWGSNAVTVTTVTPSNLQANELYHARMWTEKSGGWSYVDTTFTTGDGTAQLTYPTNGETNVDPFVPFTWTTIADAQSYTLWIGTSVGSSNIYNSGILTTTSQTVSDLLQNTAYHARLFTKTSEGTTFVDSTFTTGLGMAHLTSPAPGATGVNPYQPFQWNTVPGVTYYYLIVGTGPGLRDVFDSGPITPAYTSRIATGMLGGQTYYATLYTFIDNAWYSVASSFSTAAQPLPSSATTFRQTVQQSTGNVRLMTVGVSNTPQSGTLLAEIATEDGVSGASCQQYAEALARLLAEQSITGRIRSTNFDGTTTEQHVIVEYYDPFLAQWIVADATFGVVYWNSTTTTGLSLSGVSAAVASQNWSSLPILYVTSNGEAYGHNYYMDPILLFLNPMPPGTSVPANPLPNSPAGYFATHTTADVGKNGTPAWVFSFANASNTVTLDNPGEGDVTLGPSGGTIYSQAIWLTTGWSIVSAPAGMQMLTMNRYVYF